MADQSRRKPDEEEIEIPDDEQERGIGDEEDEEFEDTEDLGEDEDEEDEDDLESPKGVAEERGFTSEIGSEGGSSGDMERELRRRRVMRGSEATTTARTDERHQYDDRHGGGLGRPRR